MFITIGLWLKIMFLALNFILTKKQRFGECNSIEWIYKTGTIKQINIKNRTYHFYNDIIDLINFDTRLLKIDKKSYKDIDDCKNINGVNPLYLNITHANGYIEEKGVNKYLVFDSTDENKELLKKYNDVFNGIRDKIK